MVAPGEVCGLNVGTKRLRVSNGAEHAINVPNLEPSEAELAVSFAFVGQVVFLRQVGQPDILLGYVVPSSVHAAITWDGLRVGAGARPVVGPITVVLVVNG
jgi:hypothetical protein